ncbi:MAG TPA: hypothetical protein VML19_08930 [Verrucomicrobiae bacterium]|nr:hypothetical protein [Verrucomicrobiae bacterium]
MFSSIALKARKLYTSRRRLRIPTMPIADSELMAITIPKDADRHRSEATLSCSYHAGVIGIRQSLCGSAGE